MPPPVIREDFVPRNLTERQWAESMARMKALEAEQEAHQEKVEAFTAFMESSTGGNLSAAFELVRRGKPQDAAALLEGLLPELAQQPPEVQEPLLLASVRLFKEAGRPDLMAQTLHEYLRLVEERLTQGGLEGRTKRAQSELLDQVQTLLADARVAAGGGL